jgi:hypothetical protein
MFAQLDERDQALRAHEGRDRLSRGVTAARTSGAATSGLHRATLSRTAAERMTYVLETSKGSGATWSIADTVIYMRSDPATN